MRRELFSDLPEIRLEAFTHLPLVNPPPARLDAKYIYFSNTNI